MTEPPPLPEDANARDSEQRRAQDARLLAVLRTGDTDAFGRLYDTWFDRVHDLAYRILFDTDTAADVAQDTFVAAWRNIDTLEDDHAFGGWLLRIARNGALNRKRNEQRSRPVDEAQLAVIERTQTRPEDLIGTIDDPARAAEDASVAALLWDSAGALGERDRDVLDLQLRHGLAPNEIADVIGVNRNAANQLVHRVRQRLGTAVGARTLWRDGTPTCAALRAELVDADINAFDANAVRVIDRHANACADCETRRERRLSPAAMFAALPILSVPALKAKVAAALDADGVPTHGYDAHGSGGGAGMTGSTDAPTPRGRVRRVALGLAAAAAVIVVATWVGATRLDEDPADPVSATARGVQTSTSAASTSTTSTSSTTTTSVAVAPTAPAAPSTTAGLVVVPPAPPPARPPAEPTEPPAPPPAPTATFAITPARMPRTYVMLQAPTLAWTTSGFASVTVSGPAGFSATTASGSAQVCPGPNAGSLCVAPPGPHFYTLQGKDAAGAVLETRNATLTIA